jgi:hypothetical protein
MLCETGGGQAEYGGCGCGNKLQDTQSVWLLSKSGGMKEGDIGLGFWVGIMGSCCGGEMALSVLCMFSLLVSFVVSVVLSS